MSKRGTENQITKDSYERDDDDDSSSVMGTFRKASNDELARRPMKAMRRLGSRTSSNLSDEGAKRGSPFASMSPLSTSSSQNSQPDSTTTNNKSSNPFANVSFGVAPPSSASTTSTTTATAATSQPGFGFGGFGHPAASAALTSKPANSTTLGSGTFTFNMGSNATPLSKVESNNTTATATATAASSSSSSSGQAPELNAQDREAYNRNLRGVNQSFLKKCQKAMEEFPSVNLAQLFNQYISHRMKVRSAYFGVEEPKAIVVGVSKRTRENSADELASGNGITRIGSGSGSSPKMGFGLPINIMASTAPKKSFGGISNNNNTTSTLTNSNNDKLDASPATSSSLSVSSAPTGPLASPSAFPSMPVGGVFGGFGSSTMKGAVDPPKNPTSWNFSTPSSNSFGTPSSTAPTTTLTPPPTTTTTTSTATTGSTGFSTSAASTGFGGSSFGTTAPSSTGFSGSSPKPFSFNPPKPFAFGTPAGGNSTGSLAGAGGFGGAAPKPFAFQVPSASSTPASQDDNEADEGSKDPMDGKSEVVDTREGEEDEQTVFEVRAKLYGFTDSEVKDLGVGQFRVNENNETKRRRMIMRGEALGHLKLNSWVIPNMPARRDKTSVTLFAVVDGKPKKFVVRVKEEASAEALVNALVAEQDKS
ncbi:hypothetical protein BGZ98_005511 [Dissophora globulifera]|nr:hypothetical protein BGZ98_005511 [Dissophora globulifera]